jgi:hypothetical protein
MKLLALFILCIISTDSIGQGFPVFHSKNIDVDNKINAELKQSEDHFDDEMKLLTYEEKLNTSKILSVEFDKEDCTRSYCEEYSTYHNFDVRTGEPIQLEKLFTEKGFEQVKQTIYQTRRQVINKFLKKARDANNRDAFAIYEECLESLSREDILRSGFYFEKDKIHFVRFPCSPYIKRDVDEIGPFDDVIPFRTLRKNFSAYGKDLIK